jgi:hypothetical protein
LQEREPFLIQAKEAASNILNQRIKPKETAYQFFISEIWKNNDGLANHSSISLTELTSTVLAPKWNSLTAAERAPFEKMAAEDDRRWKREMEKEQQRGSNTPRSVVEAVQSQSEAITSGPLSGQGLFAAANFDARSGALQQEDALQLWTQLDDSEQRPWKEKALVNQKNFALRALTKPRTSKDNNNKQKNKRQKNEE